MAKWRKAAHVVYQCSYHLVWTPKYRYRILQGEIKEFVEKKIRAICEWKRVEIQEMTIMPDHIHMVAIIPPKLAVAELMGILKGKTAIAVLQQRKSLRTKPYWGNHFWSRGYCVTTVGMDEEKIRRYVKYQEDAERLNEDHELHVELQLHAQFLSVVQAQSLSHVLFIVLRYSTMLFTISMLAAILLSVELNLVDKRRRQLVFGEWILLYTLGTTNEIHSRFIAFLVLSAPPQSF